MLALFTRTIRPDDFITWMLVKDLVDHRIEIVRYRRFKASLITAPHRYDVRHNIAQWIAYPVEQTRIFTERTVQQKDALAKSNKNLEEKKKLIEEIDAKLATDIAEAETKGRAQVELWTKVRHDSLSTDDHADRVLGWIGNVERLDVLLRAAEERFSATLEEIERHLRGLRQLLRDELKKIIEGEVVDTQSSDREPAEDRAQSETTGLYSNALSNEGSPMLPAKPPIDQSPTVPRRARHSVASRAKPAKVSGTCR